jgi:hypothetical protein
MPKDTCAQQSFRITASLWSNAGTRLHGELFDLWCESLSIVSSLLCSVLQARIYLAIELQSLVGFGCGSRGRAFKAYAPLGKTRNADWQVAADGCLSEQRAYQACC